MNIPSWGSTGGWVPNPYIINTKKACSNAKYLFGNAWFTFKENFNVPTDQCPLPVGTYVTSGFDAKKFEVVNFPEVYFYRKYRVACHYKNLKNEVVSCVATEINLIRSWETPI